MHDSSASLAWSVSDKKASTRMKLKHPSIGRRHLSALLIVLGLSAALLSVQYFTARKVLFDRFATLEHDEGVRSLHQVLKALEADLNQLAISTHDYAAWDDAYDFAQSHDPRFIQANFAVETLANMNVDVVWMIDLQGHELAAFERVPEQESGLPPHASGEVISLLRAQLPGLWKSGETASFSRLLQSHRGLMAYAAHPVLPTGGRGAPRALLVFARFVDAATLQRAQTTSQLPVDLYVSPQSRSRLPESAQALWNSGPHQTSRVLVPTSTETLSGFALVRDVNAKPIAIIGTHIDRRLLAFGHETQQYLMLLFAAAIGLFALIVGGLLWYVDRIVQARAASERRYRAVITQSQDTMLLVDADDRMILETNPAGTVMLGFTNEELAGMQIDDLFWACDDDVLKPVQAELHTIARPERILLVRCKDKQFIDVDITVSPLQVDTREVISFVMRDVSARKRAERQLVDNQDRLGYLAHHDPLTELLNRLGLERRLPAVIEAARCGNSNVAFLYLDIDHFKKINDLRGHTCGDRLLQIAAARLRSCLAANDLIVRMGGDEFVVVASELRDTSNAEAIATRIRKVIAEPIEVEGVPLQVTASIGVSIFPSDGADYEVLLKNADIALYEAKDAGRDTYKLFAGGMTRRVSERLATEHDLREGIRGGQFYLDYQPLIDLKTRRIASLEALVRWRHPIRGRVPPNEFIEIAEKAGLIVDIGEFVMREACRQISEWSAAGATVVPIAVNVSSRQLERQNIPELVESATQAARIEPKWLHIELTESAFMEGGQAHVQMLKDLRAVGVEVSIDDFGTGYSSLAYLKFLPVDCLKIDRAFIRDMHATESDDAIVKAIINMASSLGLTTVAEGVETLDQVRRLRELGATYAQGFYFNPPLAADECGRLLQQNRGYTAKSRVIAGS
jgi:diguanylate cyclase (GGDEF)-like protein/PAS domain S-box-containing protein